VRAQGLACPCLPLGLPLAAFAPYGAAARRGFFSLSRLKKGWRACGHKASRALAFFAAVLFLFNKPRPCGYYAVASARVVMAI